MSHCRNSLKLVDRNGLYFNVIYFIIKFIIKKTFLIFPNPNTVIINVRATATA